MRAGSIGIGIADAGLGRIGLAVSWMISSKSSTVSPYLHGSARWANISDIRASGLMPAARTFLHLLIGKEPATRQAPLSRPANQ